MRVGYVQATFPDARKQLRATLGRPARSVQSAQLIGRMEPGGRASTTTTLAGPKLGGMLRSLDYYRQARLILDVVRYPLVQVMADRTAV
jgi:hypothetical protein